jgi:hypothetical protein
MVKIGTGDFNDDIDTKNEEDFELKINKDYLDLEFDFDREKVRPYVKTELNK